MTAGRSPAASAGGPGSSSPRNGQPLTVAGRLVWAALGLVLALVIVWGGIGLIGERPGRAEPPAHLGEVPSFSLTERSGEKVTRESLLGKVWVADFIFTRCTGICPLLSGRMREIQASLAGRDGVKLVSVSVDPDHDTPAVLVAYATRQGADASRWLFLTGGWEETRDLIGGGFKLNVSRAAPEAVPEGELVTHSERMVLVDGKGRIRGYYHGTEEEGIERLLSDLELILRER